MTILFFIAQAAESTDNPIVLAIYCLILLLLIILGFWIISLFTKMHRFPIPITFPVMLSLYLQRVPFDLLGDTIRILQKHGKYVDFYRIIRLYTIHWEEIYEPIDLAKLVAPDIEITELKWKKKQQSLDSLNNKPSKDKTE